jgi:hypothetical protein
MTMTKTPFVPLRNLTGYGPELGDAFRSSGLNYRSIREDPDFRKNIAVMFAEWISRSPKSEAVNFCDITYFPSPSPASAFTIVLAPSQDCLDHYGVVLKSYISDGYSMVVHPQFKRGLQVAGNINYLSSTFDMEETIANVRTRVTEQFCANCVPTYEEWWKPNDSNFHEELPIEVHWQNWKEILELYKSQLISLRSGRLKHIFGIPVGARDLNDDAIFHLAGSIFLGFDEFSTVEEMTEQSRYVLMQVYDTCAVPELARLSSSSPREQFSHVFQGFANPISAAVLQVADGPEKSAALAALRHMQFHINLFSESRGFRPVTPNEPKTFTLGKCIEDSLDLAFDRLNSRCSIGETKRIDEYICNRADPQQIDEFDQEIKLAIHNRLSGEGGWLRNRDQLLVELGGSSLSDLKRVCIKTEWSESAEEGLWVLIFRELLFHGIVFLAARPLFETFIPKNLLRSDFCAAPVISVEHDGTFSSIEVSNIRLSRIENYEMTKDYSTLKEVCKKFNESYRRQLSRDAKTLDTISDQWISFSPNSTKHKNGCWYFTISVRINRKIQK